MRIRNVSARRLTICRGVALAPGEYLPSAGIPGTVAWVEDQAARLPLVRRAEVLPSGRGVVHLLLVPPSWLPLAVAALVLPGLARRALGPGLAAGVELAVEVSR
jgi:hypothetical protein